jgi:glycosyltransferase involved in cell wall biosynthesis
MSTPMVSVIIPTYNRAAEIPRCLDSLVAQTLRDFEVLVCDDGSKDDTGAAVEKYKDRLDVGYHWAENFGGPARPRNRGIQLARGRYVAFLDSDDWWAPRKLEKSVAALEAGADLVYHDMHLVRSAGQTVFWRRARTRPLVQPVFADLLRNSNGLTTSSVVARRELLQRIGGFSEERPWIGWEDFDTWLRLSQHTDRFRRLGEPLGYYWFGGGNISTPGRLLMNLGAFRAKYVDGPNAPLARLPDWYHYLMARGCYDGGDLDAAAGHMRRLMSEPAPALMRIKALYFAARAQLRHGSVRAA